MKRSLLKNLRAVALVATGVFLGRGAQADTILDFSVWPPGQVNNAAILQSFGDAVSSSSDGITVDTFGTPNINLTWQATGGRWDYYVDSVWSAGQLDSSDVGDVHEIVFTPNNPAASVIIKSFNFHPYYLSTERFAYDVSVVTNGVVASGPNNYNFISESIKIPVSVNYTGAAGQTVTLRLARVNSSPGAGEVEGNGGDIAADDITFAQLPETELSVGPEVLTVSPANNQVAVAPDYYYVATITNATTAVKTNTIQLRHSAGGLLLPTIRSDGGLTTVSYANPALLPPGSTNKYTLTFSDDGLPAKSYTNEVTYVVAAYQNLVLPSPIVFENFDSTPEGSVPAGWTLLSRNMVDPTSEPEITLTNLDSAAYSNWTVVDVSRFNDAFDVYSRYYNFNPPPLAWTTDYQRVLRLNPSNVVNGVFLRPLATGRMAFGDSGYRNDALGQVLYLFSPDFNLSGQTNIYLAFHSLWEQNQDSMAALEYSIDSGATWLPALYMLDRNDVATNLDGTIDSLTTLTTIDPDVTAYYDDNGVTVGGYYGAFIGVASNLWDTLAPYISPRVNDNVVESKRVEVLRLPLADNQPKVRLRFATVGTDAWYWGIDDVGLYSLAALKISSIASSGENVVVNWPGSPTVRLQWSPSLSPPDFQDVAGTLGASSATLPRTNALGFFRLMKPN